jgi:hypothetical protein
METVTTKKKRNHKRTSLSVSANVKGKEDKETSWSETTELINMSRSGAGFYLERKCEVGRLISLMIAMPPNLRCYDYDREMYSVFGLIQHCTPFSGEDKDEFHVGVAFIGKNAPPSYDKNPLQSYRIAGMNHDNTWRIVEAKADFIARKHPRHRVSLEAFLSTVDGNNDLISDEKAATEDISLSGTAIFSSLPVDVGDSVNFDCVAYNFSAKAIVRNRQEAAADDDELPKLHLEFIDAAFPVEQILFPDGKKIFVEEEN